MIEQLIYRRAEQGYRTVAVSDGLKGKGLARRLEALSTLPPSSGKKRLGVQPIYGRCALEDGLAMLMTVIDPGGIRGSHMTHAWYVPPEDVPAFAAGNAIPVSAYQTEYREQTRMDVLPATPVNGLPGEDTVALGCEAASMFAGNVQLLSQFLYAAVCCSAPTASRGYLGVCVLSDEDEASLTVRASRLMETVLRVYPLEKVRTVGYRSLWNKAEDNVRYPVFFTTPDLIGSAASVPMNYVLFDLRSGEVRLPRGVELRPDVYDRSVAQAMVDGDARAAREMLAQEARRKAEEEAKRRAEAEAKRKAEEAEAKRRAEAEAKRKAEEAEAKRKAEEEAKRKAEEAEAKRKAEEEAKRRAETEAKRRAEEVEAKRRAEAKRKAEEAEARRKAKEEEDERRRKAEEAERARKAEEAEARRKAKEEEDERRRKAEEAERAHKAEEAEARRKAKEEEDERRRKAEEAERARKAEDEQQKRIREAYLRARAEQEREEQTRQETERRQAAVRNLNEQRSREEQIRKTEPSAQRPDTLNRFLSDLHLSAKDIPAHELDRKTAEYIPAAARGRGCTPMEYSAQLLSEMVVTLRDRSRQLSPMACVVIARCAYSAGDYVINRMFANPAAPASRGCAKAMAEINVLLNKQDHPAAGSVSIQRRYKWYVWLETLEDRTDPAQMRRCVQVICNLYRDNVNGALESTQRKLEELACIMVEKCSELQAREAQNILLRRATLAEVYAQLRFNSSGQPAWDRVIRFSNRLTDALERIGLYEQFGRYLDRLIDDITG